MKTIKISEQEKIEEVLKSKRIKGANEIDLEKLLREGKINSNIRILCRDSFGKRNMSLYAITGRLKSKFVPEKKPRGVSVIGFNIEQFVPYNRIEAFSYN